MANNTQNMNNSFELAADNLLDAFLDMDYNKDTIIDSEELKPLLARVGYGDLSDAGVQKIIDLFDENEDGEMDFFEFLEFFSFICLTLVKRNPKAQYLTYLFEKDSGAPRALPEECESAKDRNLVDKAKNIHSGNY